MVSDKYLNTDWINAEIDELRAIQWSPEGNKLALWGVGRLGSEPVPGDDDRIQRTPIIFDTETETFIGAPQPFSMDEWGGGPEFTWSPDGQALVFVDKDGNLWHMDANSGDITCLDKLVHEVVIWQHEAP